MTLRATERDGALVIDVIVQPRARREMVGPAHGDRLRVAVTAAAADGAANDAVRGLIARAFRVPPSAVEILRGATGRRKTIRILGGTLAAVGRILAEAASLAPDPATPAAPADSRPPTDPRKHPASRRR